MKKRTIKISEKCNLIFANGLNVGIGGEGNMSGDD